MTENVAIRKLLEQGFHSGRAIEEWRKSLRLPRKGLAALTGYSLRQIVRIETGKAEVSEVFKEKLKALMDRVAEGEMPPLPGGIAYLKKTRTKKPRSRAKPRKYWHLCPVCKKNRLYSGRAKACSQYCRRKGRELGLIAPGNSPQLRRYVRCENCDHLTLTAGHMEMHDVTQVQRLQAQEKG